jgi:hypothetical protein
MRHDDAPVIVDEAAIEPVAGPGAGRRWPAMRRASWARAPPRLPTPRWHWLLVAGLALLLVLQSVLADRARLAADAGNRAWLGALCGVLRCSLPAWHEPTAFTMTSREIRPCPGRPVCCRCRPASATMRAGHRPGRTCACHCPMPMAG